MVGSGSEQRNANWSDARRRYDAGTLTLTLVQLQTIEKHFNGRKARARAFALRDRTLFRAATESLGTAAGIGSTMQLTIASGDSANAYGREIYLPELGTLHVYANAVEKTEGVHWSMAYSGSTAGTLTWLASFSGQTITWSGDFWICVRYDVDEFPGANLLAWTSGTSGLTDHLSLPLLETKYTDEF